jgi:hypothetical protein
MCYDMWHIFPLLSNQMTTYQSIDQQIIKISNRYFVPSDYDNIFV